MRRYTIEINGQAHIIDVNELSADTFQVMVGGQQVQVRLAQHDDLAGAAIAPQMEPGQARLPAPVEPVRVVAAPTQQAPAVSAPPPMPAPPRGGNPGNSMTAPMPGVMLTVTARPGMDVKRGDELMVLEAMKMKNSLQATRDGRIAEVYVQEKQQVKYGDPLVRFEEG